MVGRGVHSDSWREIKREEENEQKMSEVAPLQLGHPGGAACFNTQIGSRSAEILSKTTRKSDHDHL